MSNNKKFVWTGRNSKSQRSIGNVYGKLTVLSVVGLINNFIYVKCKCTCGLVKDIRFINLTSGRSKSCGCGHGNRLTHGDSRSGLYYVFMGMHKRCYNNKSNSYIYYGGRGITICKEWLNNYPDFKKWALGNGYKKGLEIDRKENDGIYESENCRWVTRIDNINNRRNTLRIEYENRIKTIGEWAIVYNLKRPTLYSRIFIRKWDVEKALLTPQKHNGNVIHQNNN